jgi:hypothetical protein
MRRAMSSRRRSVVDKHLVGQENNCGESDARDRYFADRLVESLVAMRSNIDRDDVTRSCNDSAAKCTS